ncbi:MAG: hypothetical protein KAG66_21135, partial [Methylococcales bacterium]|nr:hypothetical protein [Methylococcales bacterium]
CLSRQVGACLVSPEGRIVAVGSNDVPKFGGGTYLEGGKPDNRCAVWEWSDGSLQFTGCHNTRHKLSIKKTIREEIASSTMESLKQLFADMPTKLDAFGKIGEEIEIALQRADVSAVSDLIEYSRSIHAEMDTILTAGREGVPSQDTTLFCTTYPCHNCARHLVTAGVKRVYFVEPYVKSLATELHYDAIRTDKTPLGDEQEKMEILPFTGVGHRMYEDFFLKTGENKDEQGNFIPNKPAEMRYGTALRALEEIEKKASELV